MERAYTRGPYGQIHFLDTGGDGIPLMMWPQAPMTLRQYESIYGIFHDHGIRAVGIDPPGFGNSDPPSFMPTIADWAKCIPAVMDALSIERAAVAGHHTGALVAAEAALTWPDRTRGLIVHGTLVPTEEERTKRLAQVDRDERQVEYFEDGHHLTNAFAIRRKLSHGNIPPRLLTRYVVEQFSGRGPFWHGHNAAYLYRLDEVAAKLPAETLVISNTGDVTHDHTQRFRKLRPDVRYVELEGGGVDIVDEQPDAWAGAVIAFIRDVWRTK